MTATTFEDLEWDRTGHHAWETSVNGHAVELVVDDRDGVARPVIWVDGRYSTDRADNWPDVERVFPRTYWPKGVYRGKRWANKPRTILPALVAAIDSVQAALDSDD